MSINVEQGMYDPLVRAFFAFDTQGVKFAASEALPFVTVEAQNGEIPVVTNESLRRDEGDPRRAACAEPVTVSVDVRPLLYTTENKAFQAYADTSRVGSPSIDKVLIALRKCRQALDIALEKEVAALLWNTTTFSGYTTTVTTAWSNSTADIVGDVITAAQTIEGRSGVKPNALIVNSNVLGHMLKNKSIRDQFKGMPVITADILQQTLPSILGLEKLIISSATTAQSGYVFGSGYALVARVAAPGSDIDSVAVGRTLNYNENGEPLEVKVLDKPERKAMLVQVYRFYQARVFEPAFGQLLNIAP